MLNKQSWLSGQFPAKSSASNHRSSRRRYRTRRVAMGIEQLENRRLLAAFPRYHDATIDMVIDTQESVYVTGRHTQPVDVAPGAGETWLPASNEPFPATFLAKYSSDGTLDWAKTPGELGLSRFGMLATQMETNGAGEKTEYLYVAASNAIAKFDLDGTSVWSRETSRLGEIAVDADGAIYGIGTVYNDDLDLDPADTNFFSAHLKRISLSFLRREFFIGRTPMA